MAQKLAVCSVDCSAVWMVHRSAANSAARMVVKKAQRSGVTQVVVKAGMLVVNSDDCLVGLWGDKMVGNSEWRMAERLDETMVVNSALKLVAWREMRWVEWWDWNLVDC